MARTTTTTYTSDLQTTFSKNSAAHFLNQFYDDEGWWALAWIDAYDLTHDASYLSMSKTIFADMTGGWDAACGGGESVDHDIQCVRGWPAQAHQYRPLPSPPSNTPFFKRFQSTYDRKEKPWRRRKRGLESN